MKRKLPPPPQRAAYSACQPLYESISQMISTHEKAIVDLKLGLDATQRYHLIHDRAITFVVIERILVSLEATMDGYSQLYDKLVDLLREFGPIASFAKHGDLSAQERAKLPENQVFHEGQMKRVKSLLDRIAPKTAQAINLLAQARAECEEKPEVSNPSEQTRSSKRRRVDSKSVEKAETTTSGRGKPKQQGPQVDVQIEGDAPEEPVNPGRHSGGHSTTVASNGDGTDIRYRDVTAEVDQKLAEKREKEAQKKNRKQGGKKRKRDSTMSVAERTENLDLNGVAEVSGAAHVKKRSRTAKGDGGKESAGVAGAASMNMQPGPVTPKQSTKQGKQKGKARKRESDALPEPEPEVDKAAASGSKSTKHARKKRKVSSQA